MLARSLVVESMRLGQFMSDEISCALHPLWIEYSAV